MNIDIKRKWVGALRSGKYTQGRGHLRNTEETYCCLGVLVDVCEVNWVTPGDGILYSYIDNNLEMFGSLGGELKERCQLDSKNLSALIRLNDSQKATFEEIADWIENNL